MFNTRLSDDLAVIREIQDGAIQASRTPGAPSPGNVGGGIGAISNMEIAAPNETEIDEISIDPDTGQLNHPFVVGVDYVGQPGAYIPTPKRLFDFGI